MKERSTAPGFATALVSDAPSPELGEHADDFDWAIGGWSAVVRDYAEDGTVSESTGEWWFSWVLEGRAIQDVWIVPPRGEGSSAERDRYGTTIRIFDAAQRIWRIIWINPVSGIKSELSGRRHGDRIVLEGAGDDEPVRWSFNEIGPTGFVWRGEHQRPDGEWTIGAEFILKRKAETRP